MPWFRRVPSLRVAPRTRRRGAGAAERGGFENRCTALRYRGFESPPLRHSLLPPSARRRRGQRAQYGRPQARRREGLPCCPVVAPHATLRPIKLAEQFQTESRQVSPPPCPNGVHKGFTGLQRFSKTGNDSPIPKVVRTCGRRHAEPAAVRRTCVLRPGGGRAGGQRRVSGPEPDGRRVAGARRGMTRRGGLFSEKGLTGPKGHAIILIGLVRKSRRCRSRRNASMP